MQYATTQPSKRRHEMKQEDAHKRDRRRDRHDDHATTTQVTAEHNQSGMMFSFPVHEA